MSNVCVKIFDGTEDNRTLADDIEALAPSCTCEDVSVGAGSPGAIQQDEEVYRIIISPRDYDPDTDTILERPFRKAFENGLSVMRSVAPHSDLRDITEEGLAYKAGGLRKTVKVILTAPVANIRAMKVEEERLFGVYDQTVRRIDKTKPPVRTHAGVFQRMPKKKTPNRSALQKDYAGKLREEFLKSREDIINFKNGLFAALNARAENGDFEIDE